MENPSLVEDCIDLSDKAENCKSNCLLSDESPSKANDDQKMMKKVKIFIQAFLIYSEEPGFVAVIRWRILVLLKTALTSVTRLRTANPTAFSVKRAPAKQMMTRT